MTRCGTVLFCFLAFLGFAVDALACRCRPPGPLSERFAETDGVFRGTLVTQSIVEFPYDDQISTSSAQRRVFDFKVDRSWKGVTTTQVQVLSSVHGTACGARFEDGETYLVKAYRQYDAWWVSRCSFSTTWSATSHRDTTFLEGKETLALTSSPDGTLIVLAAEVGGNAGKI